MTAIESILLIGHTHHDVGYTNSPRIIDEMHSRVVGEVLDLCDADDEANADRPTRPDRFCWTFEVARPVLRFLAHASATDAARLASRVAEGRVSVTGGYLNMTQLPSDTEFSDAYDQLQALRTAGIHVRTEQHGDVNGIAWGTVTDMRRVGIDRLVMALNPDHGRPPFRQPTGFWWEGPTGERVFTWLSTHYGFGEEWGIIDADVESAEAHILEFVQQLAGREDYRYNTAVVHAANDNRWPTMLFLRVVRYWNRMHPELPMRTATIDDAMDTLQEQAADAAIPVVRGEWSDWWSHGHGSTAREVAVYREARSFARAAQASLAIAALRGEGKPALATVLGNRRGPVRMRTPAEVIGELAAVDEQLLLFDEHTWGSWETYSKPHSIFSHSHWNAKAGFAYGAWDLARDLAIEGMFRSAASGAEAVEADATCSDPATTNAHQAGVEDGTNILVLNPSERERAEPVTVEIDGNRSATAIATVPAFGSAVVPVPGPIRSRRRGYEISTERYSAVIDPTLGGMVSLVDRASGREWVDAAVGHGVGAVVVETVPGDSAHPMLTHDPKDFNPNHPGPQFDRTAASDTPEPGISEPQIVDCKGFVRIEWTSSAPGIPRISSALTLYHDLDTIDLDVQLVKPESFDPESIFVAFPFAVDDPTFLLETAGAVYEADAEQLQDTSKDWYSIQNAAAVVGSAGGVLWGSIDAPLVQLGGFHTGQWARRLHAEGGQINSWLMNNLHFTNFQARQEGSGTYRYRFAPKPNGVTREDVRVFGRNLREPMHARQYAGPLRLRGSSGLRVEPADAVLVELRPVADSGVRVRLRNITAEPVQASVRWNDIVRTIAVMPHGIADAVLPS